MKIVVCVKPVPLAVRLDATTSRVDRHGPAALNALDQNAIETALQIRDRAGESEVVLLALATESAADALKPGLAMGADRALVVSGAEFAGSDLLGTSLALAEALRTLVPDLVVFGAASSDGNGAMLWAAVAERLSLPVISRAIDVAVDQGRVTATRQMEYGLDVVEADLPAVVAISGEINTPRYPSFKDVISAKKKAVTVLTMGDLKLDPSRVGEAGARTRVLRIADSPARGKAELVYDDGHAHEHVVRFLTDRHLLP